MFNGIATSLYIAYEQARRHHRENKQKIDAGRGLINPRTETVIPQSETGERIDNTCPECQEGMFQCTMNGVELRVCLTCVGHWFEAGALKAITGLAEDVPGVHFKNRASKYTCPDCAVPMQEYVFVNPKNLLVDLCPQCSGVYLEAGEIGRAIKLVALEA